MLNTTHIHPIRTLIGVALAALLLLVVLSPPSGQAAGKTETLRFFSKPVSFTYTAADGTVTHRPPDGPPQAGDVMEIDSLDYAGTHKKHSKRPKGSDYLRCEFNGGPGARLPRLRGDRQLAAALPRHGRHRRHRALEERQGAQQQGGRGRLRLRPPAHARLTRGRGRGGDAPAEP